MASFFAQLSSWQFTEINTLFSLVYWDENDALCDNSKSCVISIEHTIYSHYPRTLFDSVYFRLGNVELSSEI